MTEAWVPRDAMLGAHVKLFHEDGVVEHVTIRLHPEAHAAFAEQIRAVAFDRLLRTRADLQEAGERMVDVEVGATDTAAWRAAQVARAEDEQLVVQALLRPLLRARDLSDIMRVATKALYSRARGTVTADAWVSAVRALRPRIPRWDADVLDLDGWPWPERLEGKAQCEEYGVSADPDEVVLLVVEGEDVHVERVEHDRSEAVQRARGVLTGGPTAVTREG
jgi:hypothetical protein